MSKKCIDLVKKKFSDAVLSSHSRLGVDNVEIDRDSIIEVLTYLRDDDATKMNFCRDITAVDYLNRDPRFEIIYVLYSMEKKHQLVLRVPLKEADVKIDSAAKIWGCASWLEREVFDMYGIQFNNHPDLRRVLLYDEFEGHPLRKDYDTQKSQPRTELLARERDSVEEYYEYVKEQPAAGSREEV